MQIKLKFIAIFTLLWLFIMGGMVWYITYLNKEIQRKEDTILIKTQNNGALPDQMNMMEDSLQNFAITVTNLQSNNKETEKKYNILKSRYRILIDSLIVLNENASVIDTGDVIRIDFNGRQGKVTYKGHTKYFKLTGKGTYSITIGIDPTVITSSIYLDKETNLIRNEIFADGELIDSAKTTVDSTIYLAMQGGLIEPVYKRDFFDRLGLTLSIKEKIIRENELYIPGDIFLGIGVEYEFDKVRIFGEKDILNSRFELGIKTVTSFKDLWKLIF